MTGDSQAFHRLIGIIGTHRVVTGLHLVIGRPTDVDRPTGVVRPVSDPRSTLEP